MFVEAAAKDIEVVETATLVALGPSEYHDLYSNSFANSARAPLPRSSFQQFAVLPGPVSVGLDNVRVGAQCFDDGIGATSA